MNLGIDNLMPVLVIGAGITGQSLVRYLGKIGQISIVFDPMGKASSFDWQAHKSRLVEDIAQWSGDCAFVSPGISFSDPLLLRLRSLGVKIYTDLDLLALQAKQPIIAVTGTNGKTSVVEAISFVAKGLGNDFPACGNIGLGVLDCFSSDRDGYVVEVSSQQMMHSQQFHSHVGVVLNIGNDHWDWHGGFAAYKAAKLKLLSVSSHAVVNENDAVFSEVSHRSLRYFDEKKFVDEIKYVPYLHAPFVMAAVLAVADAMGWAKAHVCSLLRQWRPSPHRCQTLGEIHGRYWIDDSKGTNMDSPLGALAKMQTSSVILLLGGRLKSSVVPWGDFFKKVSYIITFSKCFEALDYDGDDRVYQVSTLKEAVEKAYAISQKGDTILLSPGGSSHDAFRDYVHRGLSFQAYIKEL